MNLLQIWSYEFTTDMEFTTVRACVRGVRAYACVRTRACVCVYYRYGVYLRLQPHVLGESHCDYCGTKNNTITISFVFYAPDNNHKQ